MPNKQHTTPMIGQYRYHRDFTGAAARIRIEDPQGNGFPHIYFWDDPDTAEALLAEKKATMLVAALNLTGGGRLPCHISAFARFRSAANPCLTISANRATRRSAIPHNRIPGRCS